MRRFTRLGILLLLVWHVPDASMALAPRRIGGEFRVNNQTADDQAGNEMAADGSGNFMVVWRSELGVPDTKVVRRLWDCTGRPLTGDLLVNDELAADLPSVAAGSTGFVVAWHDGDYHGTDGSGKTVLARLYDGNGTAEGDKFQVNTTTFGAQHDPVVAAARDRSFVVVWPGRNDGGCCPESVYGQRYDGSGTPVGSEFEVSPGAEPAVAMTPDGDFVVAWRNDDGDGLGIAGRRYDSTGTPQGSEFAVNTTTAGNQRYPAVAVDPDGNFLVAWDDESENSVRARRFDSSGAPLGDDFLVSLLGFRLIGFRPAPAVAADDLGNFVVVWAAPDFDGFVDHVVGQLYDANGVAQGGVFQVSTDIPQKLSPAIAMLGRGGDFVVTWSMSDVPGSRGVFGQRFGGACGNGRITSAEECDDGNIDARDGCDDVCKISPCWTCVGEPSVCTFDDICAAGAGVCTTVPRGGCRAPTVDGQGGLRLKDFASDAKDKLVWKWSKGEATLVEDFGDPLTTTDYAFCLYDGSAASQPVMEAAMPADGTCGTKPCWKPRSTKGFSYKDTERSPDGVLRLSALAGVDGKARVTVKGNGANLPMPQLPLDPPIIAQLQASNGECWEAEYGGRLLVRNDAARVQARPGIVDCTTFRRKRSPSGAFLDATSALLE